MVLRAPTAEDILELVQLNLASAQHYQPWATPPATIDEATAYLVRSRERDTAYFLVCHAASGAIMGGVNLSQIFYGNFQSAYMGYYIAAPYARQGFMGDAVATVLGYAFGQGGLHRVEANIQPDNAASIGLVRRLGFQREGYSPRYLLINGAWRDHERWAILAEDWLAR